MSKYYTKTSTKISVDNNIIELLILITVLEIIRNIKK